MLTTVKMDDDDLDYPDLRWTEEPECFVVSPPSLKRLAVQKMSLMACYYDVAQNKGEILGTSGVFNCFPDPNLIFDVIPDLEVMISDCLYHATIDSVGVWFEFHLKYVFFEYRIRDIMFKCMEEMALRTDGTVDFSNTARNILRNDNFCIMHKYRLACINCFVDEIKKFWPRMINNPIVTRCDVNGENPMVRYWTRVMKGESLKLPGDNPESIESFTSILPSIKWTAVEYFWDTLSGFDQMVVAETLFADFNLNNLYILEALFLKSGKAMAKYITIVVDVQTIFEPFFESLWNRHKIYDIWNYIKYFISFDVFVKLLKVFIDAGFSDYYNEGEDICSMLFEIWENASDELRQDVLNDMEIVEDMFRLLHENAYQEERFNGYYSDMRFFIDLLTELDFQSRNKLWCKYWSSIILSTAPKCMDHFLSLCFNNDDEIDQFKEHHMMDFNQIDEFCYLLIKYGDISMLNNYLSYCSSDVHRVAFVKRQILDSCLTSDRFHHAVEDEEFIALDEFIDSAFLDENDAKVCKRKLLSLYPSPLQFYHKIDKTQLGTSWE